MLDEQEVAEIGVIRKVELVNFMCHDFLECVSLPLLSLQLVTD